MFYSMSHPITLPVPANLPPLDLALQRSKDLFFMIQLVLGQITNWPKESEPKSNQIAFQSHQQLLISWHTLSLDSLLFKLKILHVNFFKFFATFPKVSQILSHHITDHSFRFAPLQVCMMETSDPPAFQNISCCALTLAYLEVFQKLGSFRKVSTTIVPVFVLTCCPSEKSFRSCLHA